MHCMTFELVVARNAMDSLVDFIMSVMLWAERRKPEGRENLIESGQDATLQLGYPHTLNSDIAQLPRLKNGNQ